jgi:hypothetical protein
MTNKPRKGSGEGCGAAVPKRPISITRPFDPFFIAQGDRTHGPFASIRDVAAFAAGLPSEPAWRVVYEADADATLPTEWVAEAAVAQPEKPPDAPARVYRNLDFRKWVDPDPESTLRQMFSWSPRSPFRSS